MKKIFVNTDGGSRGNPGPAALGIVFYDDKNQMLHTYKKFIGQATNNEAEYQAIITALKILSQSRWFGENNSGEAEIICRLDSQLVVEQLTGNYKIKQEHIKQLVEQVKKILENFQLKISFVHVPREQNKEADKLVNEALDETIKKKNIV